MSDAVGRLSSHLKDLMKEHGKAKAKTKAGAQAKASTQASPTTKGKPPPDEGKGKDEPVTDAEGIDADDYGPQWFMREFHNDFAMITAMWHDVFGRLMTLAYNKGKGKVRTWRRTF